MRVAVSWSGGKESGLAYFKAMNEGHEISLLVTFLWQTPLFYHPLELMELQSKALGIPHVKVFVKPPYFEGYKRAVSNLIEKYGVKGIVTGDIFVTDNYHGDWMKNVCDGIDVELIRPLWEADPHSILKELVSGGFKVVFTSVKKTWFKEYWLGRVLDDACIDELKELEKKFGIDLCGERGEYHTMVVDAPMFKEFIEIFEFRREDRESSLILKPVRFSLKPKIVTF